MDKQSTLEKLAGNLATQVGLTLMGIIGNRPQLSAQKPGPRPLLFIASPHSATSNVAG